MDLFHPSTAVILALILSVFIPLVSSLLSRTHWPSEVTGILTLTIATANGFFTEWAQSSDSGHYDWKTALGIAIYSFVIAVVGRLALWKGTQTDATILQFPRVSTPNNMKEAA